MKRWRLNSDDIIRRKNELRRSRLNNKNSTHLNSNSNELRYLKRKRNLFDARLKLLRKKSKKWQRRTLNY